MIMPLFTRNLCQAGTLLRTRMPYGSRRGFTLTEMAIVFAVVTTILGIIWAVGSDVRLSDQVRSTDRQLATIVHNIRAVFTEQSGVTGMAGWSTTQAFDQLKIFPLEMRQNGGVAEGILFNIWSAPPTSAGSLGTVYANAVMCTAYTGGTTCSAYANDATGAPQPFFGVTYTNVPQNACEQLLTVGTGATGGIVLVWVSNGEMTTTITASNLPTDIGTATTACSSLTESATDTIEWVYLLRDNG